MEITGQCQSCKKAFEIKDSVGVLCDHCHKNLLGEASVDFLATQGLNQCPVCGGQHLYQQKDFNRVLGVMILIAGCVAAFYTYGLSLLLLAVLDLWLHKKIGMVGICYRCKAQFRKSNAIQKLSAFDLKLHDYYRSLALEPHHNR